MSSSHYSSAEPFKQERINQPSHPSLSQSFFNSQNQPNQSSSSHQIFNPSSYTGLSRFLSTSFVNPIYKSKIFPSSVASENPLFYSTREGYEIGLNSDEDILPHEDDDRLVQENYLLAKNSRGIDDALDEPSNSSNLISTQSNHPISSSQSTHSKPVPNPTPSQLFNPDSSVEDEDPFYIHPPSTSLHPPNQTHIMSPTHPTLPRHLMAEKALSNYMASEISFGNYQYYAESNRHSSNSNQPPQVVIPSHAQQALPTTQSNPHHNLHPEGWRIYQSIGPSSIPIDSRQNSGNPNASSSSSSSNPSSTHAPNTSTYTFDSNFTIPPELKNDLHLPSELTERPNIGQRQTAPEPEVHHQAYPVHSNESDCNSLLPIVYIYPTEARDIGTEVPGQVSLGPQNYRDSFWMLAWLASLLYAFLETLWILFISNTSLTGTPKHDGQTHTGNRSNGLMKTLPILALLITMTFGICLFSLSLLLMVKRSIKYLVYGTILGIPSILGIIGLWTWSESLSDPSQIGMGYISFFTILISVIFLKFMWSERARIDRTIQVLNLSISVVIEHPSLIMVSLTMSIICIVLSIPFITLIFQLILSGYQPQQQKLPASVLNSGTFTHVLVTGFIWSWSLNVIRNLQRIIIAGVVSHWYFNRHSPAPPPLTTDGVAHDQKKYSPIDSTYQSISRAIGPSFGTVCFSGFLLTIFDSLSKFFKMAKTITHLQFFSNPSQTGHNGVIGIFKKMISNVLFLNSNSNFIITRVIRKMIEFLSELFVFLNSFTLIYSGITGFNFTSSFKNIQSLIFKHDKIGLIDNLLAKSILNIISLTMSLTISLIGYHIYNTTLSETSKKGPAEAGGGSMMISENFLPLVFVLFGLLPFWIFRFLTDLILNSIDTLFLCWNIDLDVGTNHSNKTQMAFTGKPNY